MAFPGAQPLGAFGHYRLLKRIAKGGMAEIFLALLHGKAGFEKVVVLKRVLPELAEIDEFVQVFLDEARLAARLDHPNVGRVYELGEVSGQYYLAMEYLPGEDLASVIQQCRRTGNRPSIDVAAEIALGACEGLHFAHTAASATGQPLGIVHRDISPSNVVVTYHGQVKVIDFGIARAESNLIRTAGGKPKGKVWYMAPEQAAGGRVDVRSDIFSLGVVLHELLTTERLFRRPTDEETLRVVLAAEVAPPSASRPEVPASLDRVVARALAREPAHRYQTAGELAADLRGLLAERNVPRSSEMVSAFMLSQFSADRRNKKLRVSQGMPLAHDERDLTPVVNFEGLTPIRSSPKYGVPVSPSRPPPPAADAAVDSPTEVLSLPPAAPAAAAEKASSAAQPAGPANGARPLAPSPRSSAPAPPAVVERPFRASEAPRVQAPAVQQDEAAAARERSAARAGRRGPGWLVWLAAVVLGAVGYLLGLGQAGRPPPSPGPATPSAPVAQAAEPNPAPPPPPSDAPTVAPSPVVEATPDWGELIVHGVPAGASARVGGEAVGAAPRRLAPGAHVVQVSGAGSGGAAEYRVEVVAGRTVQLELATIAVAAPAVGQVEVVCRPWCDIAVDGKPAGKTSPALLSLAPGAHQLRLTNPQLGMFHDVAVEVVANQTTRAEATFR